MAPSDTTPPPRAYRSSLSERMRKRINRRAHLNIPLYVKARDGSYEDAPEDVVMWHARTAVLTHFRVGAPVLLSPKRIKEFVTFEIARRDHEVFALILLNCRGRLIDYVELFHGTTETATVYTHQILECVVEHRASKVIFVHNHPTGSSEPSEADLAMTARCRKALAFLDVMLIDHLIVGEDVYSFRDHGQLLRD